MSGINLFCGHSKTFNGIVEIECAPCRSYNKESIGSHLSSWMPVDLCVNHLYEHLQKKSGINLNPVNL